MQITDVLMKPLGHALFRTFRFKLGVHYMNLPSLRGDDRISLQDSKILGTNFAICMAVAKGIRCQDFVNLRLKHLRLH